MKILKRTFLTALIATFLLTPLVVPPSHASAIDHAPGSETMAVDLLVLKPLGFVSTVVGCGIFTLALPFTVWSKERISEAGKQFVVEPGKYTFVRPLGRGL